MNANAIDAKIRLLDSEIERVQRSLDGARILPDASGRLSFGCISVFVAVLVGGLIVWNLDLGWVGRSCVLALTVGAAKFGIEIAVSGAPQENAKHDAVRKFSAELEALRTERHSLLSAAAEGRASTDAVDLVSRNQAVSADEFKECPMCAEFVRVKAVRCRYCQHEFSGATAGGPQGQTGSKENLP